MFELALTNVFSPLPGEGWIYEIPIHRLVDGWPACVSIFYQPNRKMKTMNGQLAA